MGERTSNPASSRGGGFFQLALVRFCLGHARGMPEPAHQQGKKKGDDDFVSTIHEGHVQQ